MTDLEVNFGSSSNFSLGIEEEFQILNPNDLELCSRAHSIIEDTPENMRQRVKPELMQSIVEINTKICANIREAGQDLLAKRCLVYGLARDEGLLLACAGTHPFSRWEDQRLTPDSRYFRLVSDLQWVVRRELIFGLHVHVGVDGAEKAIAVVNGLRKYLPHLLALSANSPFLDGISTKLHSTRTKIWDAFPRGGIPPIFKDWNDYTALVGKLEFFGCVTGPRDFWWDVRPHPDFGTVEIRICDVQTEPDDCVALAALIQALVAWLSDRFDAGENLSVQKRVELVENKWRASRYGLDAKLLDFEESREVPARVAIEFLLRELYSYFEALGSSEYVEKINSILVNGNGSKRQLEIYEETGDLTSVLADIVWRTYNIERYGMCEGFEKGEVDAFDR